MCRSSSVLIIVFCLTLSLSTFFVLGQRQLNTKVLCERIANQCRETCSLYWEQCHTGQMTGQVMMPIIPGGGQMQMPISSGTASQSVTILGGPQVANVANVPQSPQRPALHPVIPNQNAIPILASAAATSNPPKPIHPVIHPVITHQNVNSLRLCVDYMQDCDVLHPCCGRYNCLFNTDKSGFGRCH